MYRTTKTNYDITTISRYIRAHNLTYPRLHIDFYVGRDYKETTQVQNGSVPVVN